MRLLKMSQNLLIMQFLEKSKDINAIKLIYTWSDLGSWKEICKVYENKKNILKKKNFFIDHGENIQTYLMDKNFLIKELYVKSKRILSLQKHFHRSEHWVVTKGKPKITLKKKSFFKNLMKLFLFL